MPASKQFKSFEKQADTEAEALIRAKPVRSVATLLNVSAALLTLRPQAVDQRDLYRRGLGVTKFGYLMPLLGGADPSFAGLSAYDVLGAWGDDAASIAVINHLYAYSEFCECAPFVHRGVYLDSSTLTHVELKFPSEAYAETEAKDIVLSNLFNPFAAHDNRLNKEWYDEKSAAPDQVSLDDMANKTAELFVWFKEWYMEVSPLSEDCMQVAIGVSTAEFVGFRAACMALAEFHTSMLAAVFRRIDAEESDNFALSIQEEMLNLMAPCWPIAFTHRMIATLAQIRLDAVEKLMTVYSTVAGSGDSRAEGFTPPFIASGENYIFGPVVAQHMMSSRNILYTCMKRDKKHFDDHISQHLEPQLVSTASAILSQLKDVQITKNFIWEAGEIDLIVYRASDNAALLFEAKATVAPEGGRMVERTETRISEALEQLDRFSSLSPERRDEILSAALGITVKNVSVSPFVLAWASFGTNSVWSRFGTVMPLNIALLSQLVLTNPLANLKTFKSLSQDLIAEVMSVAIPTWVDHKRKLGELSFTSPVLEFDGDGIVKYQMAPYKVLRSNTNWK